MGLTHFGSFVPLVSSVLNNIQKVTCYFRLFSETIIKLLQGSLFRKLLQLLDSVPLKASGPLIEMLCGKFLTRPNLAIGQTTADFITRRVELLLINRSEVGPFVYQCCMFDLKLRHLVGNYGESA